MARRGGRRSNRTITATRIVPTGEGVREQRLERQLTAIKEQQSFTRVQIKSLLAVAVQTGESADAYSFPNVRGSDEFSSLSQQFLKYRISGYKFDIYDVDMNKPVLGLWGTFHGSPFPSDFGSIADLPDSAVVPPGTGMRTLYWYPSGPLEHSWYDVDDGGVDFGGLVWHIAPGTAGVKWNVVVSAMVDFRARR